jgi:hypothetical protein
LLYNKEKLLANGDKWEVEIARYVLMGLIDQVAFHDIYPSFLETCKPITLTVSVIEFTVLEFEIKVKSPNESVRALKRNVKCLWERDWSGKPARPVRQSPHTTFFFFFF